MKDWNMLIYIIALILLFAISAWFSYTIAASDLPEAFKFWLLK